MNQNFEENGPRGNIAWTMIHHLDNNEHVGPKKPRS